MITYLIRRLFLIIPTVLGITLLTFVIINLAPGGPIEQKLQQLRFGGGTTGVADSAKGSSGSTTTSSNTMGVSEEVMEALKKQYGFDKPLAVRYLIWLKNIVTLDFGKSFTYEEPVIDVIRSKLPVSMQFGVISFILVYLVCIPLGVYLASKEGSKIDYSVSALLLATHSVIPLILGILLIVFFAGGSFFNFFPIGGLYSDNYDSLSFFQKLLDRVHHFFLPLVTYMIGSFTTLTFLMKNSVLEEIKKDYIRTARSKGVDERSVYLKHALRNALLPIATGLGGFITVFLAGSFIVENIFQLDGMGKLGLSSINSRDYNVIMGITFISSVFGLVGNIISDIIYVIVDPRIDYT